MPDLSALLIAALLASAPMSKSRANQLAKTIEPALHVSAFPGPAGAAATGVALVAIGAHESGWSDAVGYCKKNGDPTIGGSFTYYQINASNLGRYTRESLCASPPLAALRAREVLVWHSSDIKGAKPIDIFRAYASGSHTKKSDAASEMCSEWERIAKVVGLRGATCGKRRAIRWPAKGR